MHLLDECLELICFWWCWPNLGTLVAKTWLKMDHNGGFWPLSEKVLAQVHLFGECSEMIRFYVTLAKFWPSSGHRMTENGGVQPLFEKGFKPSSSNLVCTLIGWVFWIDSFLGDVGQISAL